MKRLLRSAAGKLGYEIRKSPPHRLVDFLRSRQIDVVLDVGANIGQFASQLRRAGYAGDILSFEPVPDIWSILEKNRAKDQHWRAFNVAVGPEPGIQTINVAKDTRYSSMLPLKVEAQEFHKDAFFTKSVDVKVTTIDQICSAMLGRRIFLKIDTQGYERQILEGAQSSFNSIWGIQLELPFDHLYEEVWNFDEAIAFARTAGFCLSYLVRVSFRTHDSVSWLEADCIFRRL